MKNLLFVFPVLLLISCGMDGTYKSCVTMGGKRYCEVITLKSDGVMEFNSDCGFGRGKWEETDEGFRIYDFKITRGRCDKSDYNGSWYEGYEFTLSSDSYCVGEGYDRHCFTKS
jgi:hypothetical protein